MPTAPSAGNSWLRQMVGWTRQYILVDQNTIDISSTPAMLILNKDGKPTGINGSENQKWFEIMCALAACPKDQVDFWRNLALGRYQREMFQHQGTEVNTASHAWQHLTAHLAIRVMLKFKPNFKEWLGQDSYTKMCDYNDRWWRHEKWLMNKFWYAPVNGIRAVGARSDTSLISSQRDSIAQYPHIVVPLNQRLFKWTDGYCLELADMLVKSGDDLGGTPEQCKLLYPIQVYRNGNTLLSYWMPGNEILNPACFVSAPKTIITDPHQADIAYLSNSAHTRFETVGA